jgi:hypothetical protein
LERKEGRIRERRHITTQCRRAIDDKSARIPTILTPQDHIVPGAFREGVTLGLMGRECSDNKSKEYIGVNNGLFILPDAVTLSQSPSPLSLPNVYKQDRARDAEGLCAVAEGGPCAVSE